jgi:hypothetical protein
MQHSRNGGANGNDAKPLGFRGGTHLRQKPFGNTGNQRNDPDNNQTAGHKQKIFLQSVEKISHNNHPNKKINPGYKQTQGVKTNKISSFILTLQSVSESHRFSLRSRTLGGYCLMKLRLYRRSGITPCPEDFYEVRGSIAYFSPLVKTAGICYNKITLWV